MMNSRRICPADGSQYKQSADGLVFMESAAGLSLETSKVESVSQDTSWKHMFNTNWTTRRKQQQHPVESLYESAVAIYPVASYSIQSQEIQTQE
ncbi:hypothetical protein F511_44917 [Dorcoceras hygrometricum]|uniref:Uncharacterized protein n=1 Tax=Dorcoceras hygrometricum TaxID=472368 RepID=A0A2Z7D9R9_9LAMI|nr:hypothetical protein F511_44917 [Dorcoceras hygrometricum]